MQNAHTCNVCGSMEIFCRFYFPPKISSAPSLSLCLVDCDFGRVYLVWIWRDSVLGFLFWFFAGAFYVLETSRAMLFFLCFSSPLVGCCFCNYWFAPFLFVHSFIPYRHGQRVGYTRGYPGYCPVDSIHTGFSWIWVSTSNLLWSIEYTCTLI